MRWVPAVLLALTACSDEPWQEHCPTACSRVEQCGLTNQGYALHTFASYHYCCEPYVDGSTRREEWNESGACFRQCVEQASCLELESWLSDRRCCSGAGGLGSCLTACGGY